MFKTGQEVLLLIVFRSNLASLCSCDINVILNHTLAYSGRLLIYLLHCEFLTYLALLQSVRVNVHVENVSSTS